NVDPHFHLPFHCPQLAPIHIPGWDYSAVPELAALPHGMPVEDVQALVDHFNRLHNAATPLDVGRCVRDLALSWE
ncbi:hypothetical protein BU15DRAFT_13396, partial [Melanogaster broomeanus]